MVREEGMVDVTTCSRCGSPFSKTDSDQHFAGMCPGCLAYAALKDTRQPETGLETASPPTRKEAMVPPLKSGALFHGLEIVDILGYGGMGIVYRARQTSLNRLVALKVLAPQLAASDEFSLRFDREAKVLASLNHPNIVHVYDFGKEGPLLFLSMEHVDGPTLESVLEKKRPVDLVWFLTLMRTVTRGLQKVHEAGLIHRDIKPANILITRDNTPKIGDFGLAIETEAALKLTESGMFVGTPHYVSPEHVQGKKVDNRSDLYSLGVILYQGIAGRTPFTGASATAILMKHVQEAPPPLYKFAPDAPSILGEITRKLLAKNPASRHESAAALERDLDRAIEALKTAPAGATARTKMVAQPEPPPPATAEGPGLPWKWIGAGAAVVLVVAGILIAVLRGGPEEPPPAAPPAPKVTQAPKPKPAPVVPPVFPVQEEPKRDLPVPPPAAPQEPSSKPESSVQLSTQDRRRQLDYYMQIINLCGIAAGYCDARGKTTEAEQLRATLTETQVKLDRLVGSLKEEGQNPFVDETLTAQDQLVYFEDQKLDGASKPRIAAILGTFAAKVHAGSRARVVLLRNGESREFLIRFDERPKDLNSILQVAGLIPGQTVEEPADAVVKMPDPAPVPKPAALEKPLLDPLPDAKPPLPSAGSMPVAPRKKAALPDAAAQKEAEKIIRDMFKSDYAKKAPTDQAALAETLLEQGRAAGTDLPARYVLLRESRDVSAQIGEVETTVRAVSAMAEVFEVDAVSMKAAALGKASAQLRTPESMGRFCRVYLALGEEAQEAGSPEAMQPLTGKVESAAKGAGDAGLAVQVQTMNRDLAWASQQAAAIKPHLKTLLDKPEDPAANLAVGKFMGLVQGDWARAAAMLIKSGDPLLRAAAQKELDGAPDANAQVALGDAWWNAGEKENQPEVKRRLTKRSYYWYLKAVPSLTGLSRQRAESRLRGGATVSLPGVPSGLNSPVVGGTGGGPFEDLPKPTALLVGFRFSWEGSPAVMTMVQPLYSTNGVTSQLGKTHGGGSTSPQEVSAKPGYAVGGVVLRGRTRVNGIKVIFMRIAGPALDPRDTYESEWFGDSGPGEVVLGRTGVYVIGIHGADGTQVDNLGIIQLRR
jgi:serine/threonine-protein kinase